MQSRVLSVESAPVLRRRRPRGEVGARAETLGWFSLGLGLAQLLAPGAISRLIGCRDDERQRTVMRAIGLREVAVGVGLLTQGHPGWLWARTVGDILDLALLGNAATSRSARANRIAAASAGVVGIAWMDAQSAIELEHTGAETWQKTQELHAVVTIGCSRDVVYTFWRDFENLPRFIKHLEAIRAQNGHSRWWAKAPAGIELKWDAEIVVDRPGEVIAWQSLHGSDLPNRGVVRFSDAPAGRGTEVHLELTFEPPAGRLGAPIARLLSRISEQQLRNDLRRLKQLLETGEVVHSDASIHPRMHPARPAGSRSTHAKQA